MTKKKISEKKLQANRRNAQKSTGPKIPISTKPSTPFSLIILSAVEGLPQNQKTAQ